MNNPPLISVIIPCYNRENFIGKTIESVISQTYKNWECIIVDDGSTDKSAEKIKEYISKHSSIKYRYQKNQERCIARNNGIQNAKGKYIAFLDSDDIWLNNHLQEFIKHLEDFQDEKCLFFSKVFYCQNDKIELKKDSELNKVELFHFLLTETFSTSRIIIHRDILAKYKFDPSLPGVEDLDLTLRIATEFPIVQMPQPTVHYFLGEESYTLGDKKRFEKELKYFQIIGRKAELKGFLPNKPLRRLKSMCYFHIGLSKFESKNRITSITNLIKAFLLYPRGYNGKNNKILFAHLIFNIPIIGFLIKSVKK